MSRCLTCAFLDFSLETSSRRGSWSAFKNSLRLLLQAQVKQLSFGENFSSVSVRSLWSGSYRGGQMGNTFKNVSGANLSPGGLAISGDIFGCHKVEEGGATGI